MAVSTLIQNSFTAGELDPKLRSRIDIANFYTGASKLRNVLAIPQGAVKRRPGLEYLNYTLSKTNKMVEFIYSDQNQYIILFEPFKARIFKNGYEISNVDTVITSNQLEDITFAQSNDYLLIFHQEFSPIFLLRESNAVWSTGTWPINNIPTYNFNTKEITTSCRIAKDDGSNIDFADWVDGSTYDGKAITVSDFFIDTDDIGRYIRGPLGGYARIKEILSPTHALITILSPFTNELSTGSTSLTSDEWTLEEEVFSSTYGYPSCGEFYQGKLWLASTPFLPDGVWASKTNNEQDFGNWLPEFADNGIFLRVQNARTGFHHIISGRHLSLFSEESVSYIGTTNDSPITPTNTSIKPLAANIGSKKNLSPVIVSGSTIFMRESGKSLIESTYNFADGSYSNQDLNLLATQILSDPIDMTYRKQTNTDESDYIVVINKDGTASILCILREQKVTAWSKIETDGKFLKVASDKNTIYFIVERIIEGKNNYTFERFNDDLLVDSGVINKGARLTYDGITLTYGYHDLFYRSSPSNVIHDMTHIMGKEVQIIVDNTIQTPQIVTSDIINLDISGDSEQAGLNFPIVDIDTDSRVFIKSMPINLDLGNGNTTIGSKKRISEVTAMLYKTSHLIINKNNVAIRRLGVDTLNSGVPLLTENLTVTGILGWDEEVNVSIGQTLPLPLTLLGMAYKVRA